MNKPKWSVVSSTNMHVIPFGENTWKTVDVMYVLLRKEFVEERFSFYSIKIPKDFVTDLVTGGWVFPLNLFVNDKMARSALVHDYLYTYASERGLGFELSRGDCDDIFVEMLKNDGVAEWKVLVAYGFVRFLGKKRFGGTKGG